MFAADEGGWGGRGSAFAGVPVVAELLVAGIRRLRGNIAGRKMHRELPEMIPRERDIANDASKTLGAVTAWPGFNSV